MIKMSFVMLMWLLSVNSLQNNDQNGNDDDDDNSIKYETQPSRRNFLFWVLLRSFDRVVHVLSVELMIFWFNKICMGCWFIKRRPMSLYLSLDNLRLGQLERGVVSLESFLLDHKVSSTHGKWAKCWHHSVAYAFVAPARLLLNILSLIERDLQTNVFLWR